MNICSIYREQKRAEVWLAPTREGAVLREGIEKKRGAKREFMASMVRGTRSGGGDRNSRLILRGRNCVEEGRRNDAVGSRNPQLSVSCGMAWQVVTWSL
ncbi:unnamed protein product [Sphenostylis stenocarpa]|uniref:Uncharacterized protein n=1 Tax=Sphenostylis stenocarpa TaxID=92480 RepID=A0AA86SQN0_9FABA|nr:unnamed protein product [Sphenostylis stenocarpa]